MSNNFVKPAAPEAASVCPILPLMELTINGDLEDRDLAKVE